MDTGNKFKIDLGKRDPYAWDKFLDWKEEYDRKKLEEYRSKKAEGKVVIGMEGLKKKARELESALEEFEDERERVMKKIFGKMWHKCKVMLRRRKREKAAKKLKMMKAAELKRRKMERGENIIMTEEEIKLAEEHMKELKAKHEAMFNKFSFGEESGASSEPQSGEPVGKARSFKNIYIDDTEPLLQLVPCLSRPQSPVIPNPYQENEDLQLSPPRKRLLDCALKRSDDSYYDLFKLI